MAILEEDDSLPVQAQEATGFDSFFAATHGSVYRAVLVVTRDQAAAEDAVANAYLRALERWSAVSSHPNPIAWLTRVAINDSISVWRKLRLQVPLLSAVDLPSLDPGNQADVIRAVTGLPLRQRQVVALRILAGLDTRETAEVLGISSGTVTAHLHRALAALRHDPHLAIEENSYG